MRRHKPARSAEHLDGDNGCVVVQSGSVDEGANVCEKGLSAGAGLQEVFFQAKLAVLFLVGAGGLGDAVAVEDDAGAGLELYLCLRIFSQCNSQRQSYICVQEARLLAAYQERLQMTC